MVEVNLFVALATGALILLLYHFIAKKYHYFLAKPIPCIKPTFLLGIFDMMVFRRVELVFGSKILYNTFPDAKIVGYYELTKPTYMVRDPQMIKKIAIKDFDCFTDRTPIFGETHTPSEHSLFFNSLFSLRGQKWRDMRSTLSPAFTGIRIRQMAELVANCATSMTEFFRTEIKSSGKQGMELDMKDTFSRFVCDAIATVAFGIEVDSFRDPDNEFFTRGKQTQKVHTFKALAAFVGLRIAPALQKMVDFDLVDSTVGNYFKKLIKDNMGQRLSRGIVRNDLVNMLLEARKGTLKHKEHEAQTAAEGFAILEESHIGKSTHSRTWSENDLIAQCFLFFFAAFDNISSILSLLSYELTVDRTIQERLYEEITQTEESLKGKPINYDALQQMPYMDMVVSEALRKWPTATLTDRYTNKDYVFDDGADLRFVIEKGRTVWIPILALHHDAKYFPDPERFDPERFSKANQSKIVSGTYLPFGAGPRSCIGTRLALMEIKMAMYHLLRDFSLQATGKTQIPLKLSKSAFSLQPEQGVWLELGLRFSD